MQLNRLKCQELLNIIRKTTTKSVKFKPATTKNMFIVQNGNLVQIPSKQGTVKPGLGTILATPTVSLQIQSSLGQLQYRPRPAPGTPKTPPPLHSPQTQPPLRSPQTQPPLRSPQIQPPLGQLPTLWNSSGMIANKEVTTQRPAAPLIDNDIDAQKTDTDEDGYSNIDFEDDDYQIIESDKNIEAYDPIWTSILSSPCNTFNYIGAVIPKLKQTAPYDPLLYFDMLIGSRAKFFRKLAISCSIRALNKIDLLPNFQSFVPEELQTFIGLCLQMSSLRLHNLDEYWDKNANYGFNGIEEKMSLNRFKMILEVLNFDYIQEETRTAADSSSRVNDKFAELRPLLNFFNSQMDLLYDCDRNLILNEPMLYWKGKFTWLNEVNTKFRCNAVLLHFLTEPSGVLLKIVPDLENMERKNVQRSSQKFVRQRLAIALEALQSNMGKGHMVYASKHYSSYALALELAQSQTYCAGFLDATRYGNCKELILTPLEKECAIARFAGNIMIGKYHKCHKSIYFYSSDCQAIFADEEQNIQSALRDLVTKIKKNLCSTPEIHSKMLNCQILFPTTDIKWDKRLMIYIINLLVLNAYILYTKHLKLYNDDELPPIRYEQFRQKLINSLLNTGLESGHIIQVLPRMSGKIVKKKCQICCKGGLNTYSKYFCEACTGLPGLCDKPCFKIWHDQMNKSMKSTEFKDEDMAGC
ncbi:piggyBac transposable element-derived protein 4-like isoform X2 [Eurosta solidaginis]|uniref:piggyBac transposable element-derived protein 4-like isoform X2 n=1 Tax=Eurosta solidaginis TaxID=178769 RepID=UPI003530C561